MADNKGVMDIQQSQNAALLNAQIKDLEASAKEKEANANRTSGSQTDLDRANIGSLTQGIENQKAQEGLTKVQTQIAELERELASGTLESNIELAKNEVEMLENEIESIG